VELLPLYRIDRNRIDQLLAAARPMTLEIGFGNGEALLAMARQRPEHFFIGSEVYRPGLGRLLHRIQKGQLNNIAVFDQDVIQLLDEVLPDNCLDEVCIFFPDPWQKKRHHKRRLINAGFVQQLSRRTRSGGRLFIATDWAEYAEFILTVMTESTHWRNLSKTGDYVTRDSRRPLTRFEQRGNLLGHTVFDFCFESQTV